MGDANPESAREDRVRRAIAALRRSHFDIYGLDAVDEAYVRRQPDWMLDRIIKANNGGYE
jgi:hypothetical protein